MTNVELWHSIVCNSSATKALSALIRNYGHVLAVIFFPKRALSVEWIRFLISFIGQDLQDYWDLFRLRRVSFRPKAILSE